MDIKIREIIEKTMLKKRPEVEVGDTVKVSLKIKEGDKERTQIFEGIVIATKGQGINETITVRKISFGVGVEKILPLHSPLIEKIQVVKRGTVRRSKLFYMRERVGKRALKIDNLQDMDLSDEQEVAPEVAPVEETKTEE